MATVSHATLAGADLHEPKGVGTAASATVYLANGSGGGTWSKVGLTSLDTTTVKNVNKIYISAAIGDISTASYTMIPIPFAATVTKVTTVLCTAITIADATITCRNAAGTSMGTITVAYTGSAAGDIDSLTPVANNSIGANSFMKIETDGASTDAAVLVITVEFTLT